MERLGLLKILFLILKLEYLGECVLAVSGDSSTAALELDVGETAMFHIGVSSTDPRLLSPGIMWTKGDEIICFTRELDVECVATGFSLNGTSLVIEHVSWAHSGQYTSSNFLPEHTRTYSLQVRPVHFVERPKDVRVIVGEPATFHCKAETLRNPNAPVLWESKSGRIDPHRDKNYRVTGENSLLIGKTRRKDAGDFTCVVISGNERGNATARLSLDDDDTLACRYVGSRKPLTRWLKNNQEKTTEQFRIIHAEEFETLRN